jgi:uncharacterized Fe-S center protein
MHQVLFASAHVERLHGDATLPAKFGRLLAQADFGSRFNKHRVAIKMHFGGGTGFYTLHPLFVRMVVNAVKEAGGRPYLTDGHADAAPRGYTMESVGAPAIAAVGEHGKYVYPRQVEVPGLPEVELSGHIVDADAMIVLSHGKGHGHTGYGGAIKNIGMGCVSQKSRGKIHGLMGKHFEWNGEQCTFCEQCVASCPTGAALFNEKKQFTIDEHHCRYCLHCVRACPTAALTMDQPEAKFRLFQQGMAAAVKETLATFDPSRVYYISALLNITPLCDCWGWSTPPIVPDVGILASDNIVAIEQASLDQIDADKLIPGTLPDQISPPGDVGHLFQRVHGKDPYEQVRQCTAAGLGAPEYELVNIA